MPRTNSFAIIHYTMTQLAIIRTGGKQYVVSPGQKLKIEKIEKLSTKKTSEAKKNQGVIFDEILLLQKGNKLEIGTPLVKGARVIGKFIGQGKGKKVIVFKYKAKKRYKVKKGHRQPFTEVEIKEIKT